MNYYFPHLDVLDIVWNDLLLEFIPKMLEDTDRLSYELTIAAMAHHLQDAHVRFDGATFVTDKFGRYVAPVQLIAVEGRLVVYETSGVGNPLEVGDVILGVNSRGIDEITAEMRPFFSYPNAEKALAFIAGRWVDGIPTSYRGHHALRSHTRDIEIDILRGDVEMAVNVNGVTNVGGFSPAATRSHVLLDNNIGLINPSISGNVRNIMDTFASTDGIIIDLRQRPIGNFYLEMRQYLMEEPLPFANLSSPSQTHPGGRVDVPINQSLPRSPNAFIYDRPIVLLMDEQTFSHPEWVIMSFRGAPNVTVMGPYSMGSNGNITSLPLPGGITMWYTGLGVYTLEGGQTHRIGLAPDIRVDRTIQGIKEGRDELMDAAIHYIMGKR
jgi:C-terminal processing protease CtpA/Prc